jgi:KipI family sensor histidine kinase inhibitor
VIVLPVGDSALLAELPDGGAALALYTALRASAPPWVVELVPAARTVLVVFDEAGAGGGAGAARAWLEEAGAGAHTAGAAADPTPPVVIPVIYDGPDLAEVAARTGLTERAVVAAHTGQTWTAAFIGFAPGFAYLSGEDDVLEVPRRETPRPSVAAGSVALAAGYCAVYPGVSPGGWQLIGTTSATLWDGGRAAPALLAPGARVRFVDVG